MRRAVRGPRDARRRPHPQTGTLAAIAPDAVAISVASTGIVDFAGGSYDSGTTPVGVVAVLGVNP